MSNSDVKRPPWAHAKYEWTAAHNEMVVKFKEESDRAAALLGTSFLETEMKKRLLDFLVDDDSSRKLFDFYHPLSTFSGLIDVAFALGLLTRGMRSDLTIVRKIRNHFAHHPKHVTFEDPPVSDWCRELTSAKGIPTQDGSLFRQEDARSQYLFVITLTLTYFDRFVGAATRRVIPEYSLAR